MNKSPELSDIFVLVVIGGMLISGILYSLNAGDQLLYADEEEYLCLARNVMAFGRYTMDGVTPTVFRPPLYPLLSAPMVGLWEAVGGRMMNVVTMAVTLLALAAATRRVAGPRAGLCATLLAAGYPVLFYASSKLYPQVLTSLLLVLMVFLATSAKNTSGRSRAALAGLLGGAVALASPSTLLVVAMVPAWWVFQCGRQAPRRIAVYAGCLLLVLAPWTIRNAFAFRAFIPVSANGGLNLLIGNNANAEPNIGVRADIQTYQAKAKGMNAVESDTFYRSAAVAWIRENPAQAASLYVRKYLNYFNSYNQLKTESEGSQKRAWILFFTYYPLLLLAFTRPFLRRRHPMSSYETFILLLYVLNGAFAAIFFTRIRFRLPYDVPLASVAGITLSLLWQDYAAPAMRRMKGKLPPASSERTTLHRTA